MIRFFEDIHEDALQLVGGKAMSLSKMTKAGFPVPPGFVLTTQAYSTDPEDWKDLVYDAFDSLGSEFVAVRSSGTKEDGVDDSFAGQFDTYLYVNREQLIEKILLCHESLQSERIQSYCQSKNIDPKSIQVAVVIQKMVHSEVAGVGFSVHPVTHQQQDIIIEAAYGLGEAVVSGAVTPDSYIVHKGSLHITERYTSEQTQELIRGKDGETEWVSIDAFRSTQAKLSDEHILSLATIIIDLENYYGFPVDTEWALEKSVIYMTQSRPITTLQLQTSNTKTSNMHESGPGSYIPHRLIAGDIELIASRPMTFQREELIYTCYAKYIGIDWLSVNMESNNRSLYSSKSQIDTQYQIFFEQTFAQPQYWLRHKKIYSTYFQRLDDRIHESGQLSQYSSYELMHYFEYRHHRVYHFSPYIIGPFVVERTVDPYVRTLLETTYAKEKAQTYFAIASSPSEYTQYQRMRRDICRKVLDNNKNLDDLVEQYGWYSEYIYTEQLLDISYFEAEIAKLTHETAQHEYDNITNTIEEHKQHYEAMIADIDDTEVLHWLDVIHSYVFLRTDRVDTLKKGQIYMRPWYQELASRLSWTYEEVLMLTNDEIIGFLKYAKQPNKLEVLKRTPEGYYYSVINQQVVAVTDTAIVKQVQHAVMHGSDQTEIKGLTAYPGKVTGRVKKVFSRDDIHKITPGDILVARHTMIDYTPAMKIAAGFVTDEGGITSHAAIVARELKKPCILGCKVAMKQLQDGDVIELDADLGVVRKLHSQLQQDINYFLTQDVSYEGGRSAYRIMNYLLNASYIMPHPVVDIPKDFNLISYAAPQGCHWYRSLADASLNDIYITQELAGKNILNGCKSYIDDIVDSRKRRMPDKEILSMMTNQHINELFQEYCSHYKNLASNALVLRLMDRGIIRFMKQALDE